MESFTNFLNVVVDLVWGLPMVLLLIGGGLYLLVLSKFLPLLGMGKAIRLLRGKDEERAEGQLSHFQCLTNALAATVGMGNISGVAVAIAQGGPGAVFWMWIAAFIGMNTKFFECTLAVMFRGKDYQGEVQGGPMYVIQNAMPKAFFPLAIMFAVCGLIGTQALFQANQLSDYFNHYYEVPKWTVALISVIFVASIVHYGLRGIAKATSLLVPSMCLFYVISCLVILCINMGRVPSIFLAIFQQAFTPNAAFGGASGAAVLFVMRMGVKRAAFSNEAGIGTAPMAHSNAKTNEPISEGLVAMLGPFLDTIIICTMTALVILLSIGTESAVSDGGIILTTNAFETLLPGFGKHFLGLAVLLFSLTTMLGMANYNKKCWDYLFKGRRFFGANTFLAVFCLSLSYGATAKLSDIVNILDIGYGLMAVPNMIATIYLAGKVKVALKNYLVKHHGYN